MITAQQEQVLRELRIRFINSGGLSEQAARNLDVTCSLACNNDPTCKTNCKFQLGQFGEFRKDISYQDALAFVNKVVVEQRAAKGGVNVGMIAVIAAVVIGGYFLLRK